MTNKDNKIELIGTIYNELTLSHITNGEEFYKFGLCINRKSGNVDIVQAIISEREFEIERLSQYNRVHIKGQVRTHNKIVDDKNKLEIYVFVTDLFDASEIEYDDNILLLNGFICKKPIKRVTPFGKNITDLMLAVNRSYGRTDYIPCICWGRNASYVDDMKVGSKICVEGRLQSREYKKGDDILIAYEVSVCKVVDDMQ